MNLLAPWFLAGLVLLAGPIIAHLVRRATRRRVAFSSLRLLDESAPRLDRKSRVQNPWLLALRCLILALLVLAFARPYLEQRAAPVTLDRPPHHVVVIVDQSASMQRPGLWDAAVAQLDRVVVALRPQDQFRLFGASLSAAPLAGGDLDTRMDPRAYRTQVVAALRQTAPADGPFWLDQAVEAALDEWEVMAERGEPAAARELYIVSDFARETRVAGLASVAWPANARVHLLPVAPSAAGNASVHWLGWGAERDGVRQLRVRVIRNFDAPDTLELSVRDALSGQEFSTETWRLAPGSSEVRSLPWPADARALHLVLSGDEPDFDNQLWVAPPQVQRLALYYLGHDAPDDVRGTLFYLQRAVTGLASPAVELQTAWPAALPERGLLVINRELTATERDTIRPWLSRGGVALVLVSGEPLLQEATRLAGEATWSLGVYERDDALLGQIDFRHSLFAPFADPRFSDFTRIRFWEPQPIHLGADSSADVVARFDDGQPALLQQAVGRGRVIVWGGGWNPSAGQWVLSSKYVPWLQALAESAAGGPARPSTVEIGHAPLVSQSALQRLAPALLQSRAERPASSERPISSGIYRSEGEPSQLLAVNVPSSESELETLPLDVWEQLGVPLQLETTVAPAQEHARQRAAARELEEQQGGWRLLLLLALALLALESISTRRLLGRGHSGPSHPAPREPLPSTP